MRTLLRVFFAAVALAAGAAPHANAEDARYAVLVTIDGLRWQEAFHGADERLTKDPDWRARFVDTPDRAGALMPFFQETARLGALIGDRQAGSCARVANAYWFSYPGYAEMLIGRPHPKIGANAKVRNRETTVLEYVAGLPEGRGRVRAVAEWDAAPFILDAKRNGLPVWHADPKVSPRDPLVAEKAREALAERPRLLWIAFGDTDNRAHEGDYYAYLAAAHAADAFLAELWATIEADPEMRGRTTLLVTTDHGRGGSSGRAWQSHGSGRYRFGYIPFVLRREGSDAVWFAARGPDIAPGLHRPEPCATTSQTAGTLLRALGLDYSRFDARAAAPLPIFSGPEAR